MMEGWEQAGADLVFSQICGFSGGNMGGAAELQKSRNRRGRVAHTSRRSLPGCMRPCGAHTEKWHVCPARDPIPSGAYITTKRVVTYAPPAMRCRKAFPP